MLILSAFSLSNLVGLNTIFWACIGLGAVIALLSFVVGDLLPFDFDAGGVFSGPVIATFLVLFGGGGLFLRAGMSVGPLGSTLGAGLISFGGSALVYYGLIKVIHSAQGGTSFEPHQAIGREAEVIIAIPAEGIGEIAFDTNAGRMSGGARSLDGIEIPRSTVVRIEKAIGGTYHVRIADEAVRARLAARAGSNAENKQAAES